MNKEIIAITIALTFLFASKQEKAIAVSTTVRISQVYGGGGNSGAVYQNDYVELFNASSSAVNISGWSIQYAAATSATWHVTNLSGVINAGSYYLIQLNSSGATGMILPTPDAFGITNLSATEGKIALVNNTTALSSACPSDVSIIDLVGYGSTANCFEGMGFAPAPSNTKSILRTSNGCIDTDDNSLDFNSGTPLPRNSSSATNACSFVGFIDLTDGSAIRIWNYGSKLNIDFANARADMAIIEIYSMPGQLLSREQVGSNSPYSHELKIMKPALIIVKVINDDQLIVKKLLILNQ